MDEKKRKTVKEALILFVILVLAFLALWVLAESIENGQEVKPPDSEITVSMRIYGDGWNVEYLNTDTMNNTVFSLLIECSKENDFSVDYTEWQGYDA
jgi:hypothetical protein